MEFVEGGDFFDYIKLKQFSPIVCKYYFLQILEGIIR
jgi:serine/threonine protein kinase